MFTAQTMNSKQINNEQASDSNLKNTLQSAHVIFLVLTLYNFFILDIKTNHRLFLVAYITGFFVCCLDAIIISTHTHRTAHLDSNKNTLNLLCQMASFSSLHKSNSSISKLADEIKTELKLSHPGNEQKHIANFINSLWAKDNKRSCFPTQTTWLLIVAFQFKVMLSPIQLLLGTLFLCPELTPALTGWLPVLLIIAISIGMSFCSAATVARDIYNYGKNELITEKSLRIQATKLIELSKKISPNSEYYSWFSELPRPKGDFSYRPLGA